MDSSPTTPRAGPDINTSRLLRLLRPYTSHLGQLERSLKADADHSAYTVIAQGISLTIDRHPKPDTKRTYGKGHRKASSARLPSLSQGPNSFPEDDVFTGNTERMAQDDASQRSRLLKSHVGLARYTSANDKRGQKIHQQATSVFSAFRRICEVAKPPSYRTKTPSAGSSGHRKPRAVSKLSTICASIVGHNLESYVKAEWIANERQKCGLGSDDSGFQYDSEDEEDLKDEYQDQSWRIERLQEWYDALPGYVTGTVIIQQAISLALSLPNHPTRTDLLWNMLEILCDHRTSSNLRPLLQIIVGDTMARDASTTPLVLSGISDLLSPSQIPPEVERGLIPHLSTRKKYLAMHPATMGGIAHCELAAAMVAAGIHFTYNTDNQRQVEEFDSYTARWISLWTETITSTSVTEETHAWHKLYDSLTDVGFLSDSLPIDNSPNVYLVAFTIALLNTAHTTDSEIALLRQSLRCLRSNPGIDFNILHPSVLSLLYSRMLLDHYWKTECPHITRWFLAHLQRKKSCPQHQVEISNWISELEIKMPEVEERDVETRKAYGKLGYVWDTTFDCWVHMTPQGKTEPMDEASSPDADDRGAASSRSRSANVESSTTFSGDRSSPTAYMPTSPPTMTMQQNISLRGSSPISKTPTFSSPFIQSPFVRSTVTPKHLLKSKHKKTNSVLARSVYATPTQPMRTVAPNTVESIDPLDDIEELDKTTPVLPKRVSVRSEAPRPLKQLEHPSSELDGTDPLVDGFSDIPLEHVWMPINVPPSISSSKRKATAPLESLHLKKRHQLESL